ncbi:MAG: hypothetical protein KA981_07620 [Bacteroidia bacterium]|nr:hypothetical protein [Bacteroidia bacterium]
MNKFISYFLAFICCFLSACETEDICPNKVTIHYFPTDTTWMSSIGKQKTRSLKSSLGNFQSVTNSGNIFYSEIHRYTPKRFDAEQCREYYKQNREFNARTSIYGIFVNFQVVFDPIERKYFFELIAKDYETPTTFLTHHYVLPNPDENQTFNFSFHGFNFDTSYMVIPQKFDTYTNSLGISFKEVYVFEFPFVYLANSPAYLRRVWFSKYDGIIGYQNFGGEKWESMN